MGPGSHYITLAGFKLTCLGLPSAGVTDVHHHTDTARVFIDFMPLLFFSRGTSRDQAFSEKGLI